MLDSIYHKHDHKSTSKSRFFLLENAKFTPYTRTCIRDPDATSYDGGRILLVVDLFFKL